ncbi:MAG TPA: T9SS type A sorting domain-containing protein, partial [bacterium]|nr:T9SS type A sorting domain-containing protein [bacterium]
LDYGERLQTGIFVRASVTGTKLVSIKTDSLYAGVRLNGNNSVIEDLSVFNCKYGVIVRGDSNTISGNQVIEDFWHQFLGVYLATGSTGNTISAVYFSGLARGVVLSSSNNTVVDNHFSNCGYGIGVSGYYNKIADNAGLCLDRGIVINPPATGNVGTGNIIQGQFYDPKYPDFDPNIVGGTTGGNNVVANDHDFKASGVEAIIKGLPTEFSLAQNYPNPFNPATTISYDLSAKSYVQLTVFNATGQTITRLVDEEQGAGSYQVSWDGSAVPTGIYFYRIEAGDFVQTKKMTLMK